MSTELPTEWHGLPLRGLRVSVPDEMFPEFAAHPEVPPMGLLGTTGDEFLAATVETQLAELGAFEPNGCLRWKTERLRLDRMFESLPREMMRMLPAFKVELYPENLLVMPNTKKLVATIRAVVSKDGVTKAERWFWFGFPGDASRKDPCGCAGCSR